MQTHDDLNNHSKQLNPNNDAYWQARVWEKRPDDWREQAANSDSKSGR